MSETGHTSPEPSKIIHQGEVVRWIEEGKTYRWMVAEYGRKCSIATTIAMWSSFRHRRGLNRRIAGDEQPIPWQVKMEHRKNYNLAMLRVETRRREGLELRPIDLKHLKSWLAELAELSAVVLYDPDTPDGFFLVPREDNDDDLIRQPTDSRHRTKRRRAD